MGVCRAKPRMSEITPSETIRRVPVAEEDRAADEGRRQDRDQVGDAVEVVARHRVAQPRDQQQREDALGGEDPHHHREPPCDAQPHLARRRREGSQRSRKQR